MPSRCINTYAFYKSKKFPISTENIKKICTSCRVYAEIKSQFYWSPKGTLKLLNQWNALVDFKGPLPMATHNPYLFLVVDEYSRYTFAFSCPNTQTSAVINCLETLFNMCGMPGYIHSEIVLLYRENIYGVKVLLPVIWYHITPKVMDRQSDILGLYGKLFA